MLLDASVAVAFIICPTGTSLAGLKRIDFDELRERLSQLDEMRRVAEEELEALSKQKERIAELERDRDHLLDSYTQMTPEGMDMWTAEERHRVYQMLRLRVYAAPHEPTEVEMCRDVLNGVEQSSSRVR